MSWNSNFAQEKWVDAIFPTVPHQKNYPGYPRDARGKHVMHSYVFNISTIKDLKGVPQKGK